MRFARDASKVFRSAYRLSPDHVDSHTVLVAGPVQQAYVLWRCDPSGSVARSAIEHHQVMCARICFAEVLQKRPRTRAIHAGKVKAEALPPLVGSSAA